jgi:hypothetical protein
MVSFLLLFLGTCGIERRQDRLGLSALVTFAFACIAGLIATAVSGFIVPSIMQHMAQDAPANARIWQIAIDSTFQINQAFAKIFSVATALAIALWSIAALRNQSLSRSTAIPTAVSSPP